MSSKESKKSFPDQKQRVAFCHSQWKNKSKSTGGVYVYEDPKTGELFHYSRRGIYRKNRRLLVFKGKADKLKQIDSKHFRHILNQTEQAHSDDKAGYPPNCNDGYVEKDGKCVPAEK